MVNQGYFSSPSIYNENRVVFVWKKALWVVNLEGGRPERLSADHADMMTNVIVSPCGEKIAFLSRDEVFVQEFSADPVKRIYICKGIRNLISWDAQGIVFSSSHEEPFAYMTRLYRLCLQTQNIECLPYGVASDISWGPQPDQVVIQRAGYGYALWHGYEGGSAGILWVKNGPSDFRLLRTDQKQNHIRPVWAQDRIFFLSDRNGMGNLFSVNPQGEDLVQHSHHDPFYAMNMSSNKEKLTYTAAGVLYVVDDLSAPSPRAVEVTTGERSSTLVRRTHDPRQYVTDFSLSNKGKHLTVATRGRLFQLTSKKGPVWQKGLKDGVRYQSHTWTPSGQIISVANLGTKDELHVFESADCQDVTIYQTNQFCGLEDWGHLVHLEMHPSERKMLVLNHRHQLLFIDLDQKECHVIDQGESDQIKGVNWSACGRWAVYGRPEKKTPMCSIIVYDTKDKKHHAVVEDGFYNKNPVFDPQGKYLFFLSARHYESGIDPTHFSAVFDEPFWPFVLTLQKETESPLTLSFRDDAAEGSVEKNSTSSDPKETCAPLGPSEEVLKKADEDLEDKKEGSDTEKKKTVIETSIDFDNIASRIQKIPVPARDYHGLWALKDTLFYQVCDEGKSALFQYSFMTMKEDLFIPDAQDVVYSPDREFMAYIMSDRTIGVTDVQTKVDPSPDPSRKEGGDKTLDWGRIFLDGCPMAEWRHMFDETWRLQRDMFWDETFNGKDWDQVYARYHPLIERVGCDEELWSIVWQMHGELRTSHAYVMPREKKRRKSLASLGAFLEWDTQNCAYRIATILQGNPWEENPLRRPGLNISEGDLIWAIDGQALSPVIRPEDVLVGREGQCVSLLMSSKEATEKRSVFVFPVDINKEREWIYHQWVAKNAAYVHEKSQGQLGYIHLPDMSMYGMDVFMRSYIQEHDYPGVIVDARFNGGGNVSELIFRFLTQKRVGYDQSRWHGLTPYPRMSLRGPLVALANEFTGSDGDIFSYTFKMLGLGPVIGKRTWGGVVGICPRYTLLDGSQTSQPEFAFWFPDKGWSVEGYGVDPDIEVEISPEENTQGKDPQLDRAIEEGLERVAQDQDRQKTLQPRALS